LVFGYSNDAFFPIDGRGYGNLPGWTHNFNFAFASHMRFTFQGYETFHFVGDDDLYIFVNNLFALDLGGVHPQEIGDLDLTYPAGGCDSYTFDRTNPPLPCANKFGKLSGVPCACLLGLVPGIYGNDNYW
jgi:fibro-slime domain-containing protein